MIQIDFKMFIPFVVGTQYLVADVSTLAPAWFILATNKQIRQEIIKLFTFNPDAFAFTTVLPPHLPDSSV